MQVELADSRSSLPWRTNKLRQRDPSAQVGHDNDYNHALTEVRHVAARISYLASTNPKWWNSLPVGAADQALSLLHCDVTADYNWIKRFLPGCLSRLLARPNEACVRAGNQA